jgi:hypothetical protein
VFRTAIYRYMYSYRRLLDITVFMSVCVLWSVRACRISTNKSEENKNMTLRYSLLFILRRQCANGIKHEESRKVKSK